MKTERKSSGSGAGVGRAVSLDNVTIGEKSAITRRMVDHQEKPNASSKERVEGSDRTAKSNRSVTFPITMIWGKIIIDCKCLFACFDI